MHAARVASWARRAASLRTVVVTVAIAGVLATVGVRSPNPEHLSPTVGGRVGVASAAQTGWTSTVPPVPFVPNDPGTNITAAACPGSLRCVAVGTNPTFTGATTAFIATEVGEVWRPIMAPLPSDAITQNPSSRLDSVSCPTVNWCMAIGSYYTATSVQILVEIGHGSTWAPSSPGLSYGATFSSSSLACAGVGDCLLADSGRFLVFTSGAWQPMGVPIAADVYNPELSSVACPTPGACVIAGIGEALDASLHPLVVWQTASGWSALLLPQPPQLAPSFTPTVTALSCATATVCAFAGGYSTPTGPQSFVASGSAGTWAVSEIALPADAASNPQPAVSGVACTAPLTCLVAGSYTSAGNEEKGFGSAGFGAQWTLQVLPVPPDAVAGYVVPVNASCGAQGACVVSDEYVDKYGIETGVDTLSISGGSLEWLAPRTLQPPGLIDDGQPFRSSPSATACPASGGCAVFATAYNTLIQQVGVVYRPHAGNWTGASLPAPEGSGTPESSNLFPLSCPSSGPASPPGGQGG